jgi:hypothetical protein
MCEKAVHAAWASVVMERARYFGALYERSLDAAPALPPIAPGPVA